MNRQILTPTDDVWQTTLEELITDNDRLRARVADLESNAVWLSALLKAALAKLHTTYLRERREHEAARERLGLDDDDRAEWAA